MFVFLAHRVSLDVVKWAMKNSSVGQITARNTSDTPKTRPTRTHVNYSVAKVVHTENTFIACGRWAKGAERTFNAWLGLGSQVEARGVR